MSRPPAIPREQRMRRTQWVELVMTVVLGLGTLTLFRFPGLTAIFLAVMVPLTVGLMVWQYRSMDEFRRARYLRAWAASGISGMLALTGLIVWGVVGQLSAGTPTSFAAMQIPVQALYVPWGLSLLTFYAVTAYLYRRDTRE